MLSLNNNINKLIPILLVILYSLIISNCTNMSHSISCHDHCNNNYSLCILSLSNDPKALMTCSIYGVSCKNSCGTSASVVSSGRSSGGSSRSGGHNSFGSGHSSSGSHSSGGGGHSSGGGSSGGHGGGGHGGGIIK